MVYINNELTIFLSVQEGVYYDKSEREGRRSTSDNATDVEPLPHISHLNHNEKRVCKTTKNEEEKYIEADQFVTGR